MILNRQVPAAERPVLLLPTQGTDSYGDPVETWDPPQRVKLPRGAQVQDRDSEEDGGELKRLGRSEKVLYCPGPPRFDKGARIEHLGETYRVDGDPVVHRGLRGAVYTSSTLTRTEGA